ncbi:uncharacterized protein LOC129200590, partial [Grus americana]|uniref:uncharacterized protein LOC129200590 n=1 Tax=Grus americana TaxID=9117 RepID=UPI0024083D6B
SRRVEEKPESWKWPQLGMNALSMFVPLRTVSENLFLLQQKYSNIPCFWEKQPSGCLRISCAFHHSKPRSINGLFLPPSNNAPLQQGVQEGIPHPAHGQESLRNQKNILRPIHPPLTIHLNDEDDDEDDDEEEENGAPDWVPQTAADLEEERAIKEICYQSGEYYGIQYPQEHQSTKTVSSPRENELLPWEATERDLQAGDGDTVPTTFKNAKGEGESSGTTVPAETIPRTDRGSFENGGIHTPDPKAKPRRQQGVKQYLSRMLGNAPNKRISLTQIEDFGPKPKAMTCGDTSRRLGLPSRSRPGPGRADLARSVLLPVPARRGTAAPPASRPARAAPATWRSRLADGSSFTSVTNRHGTFRCTAPPAHGPGRTADRSPGRRGGAGRGRSPLLSSPQRGAGSTAGGAGRGPGAAPLSTAAAPAAAGPPAQLCSAPG